MNPDVSTNAWRTKTRKVKMKGFPRTVKADRRVQIAPPALGRGRVFPNGIRPAGNIISNPIRKTVLIIATIVLLGSVLPSHVNASPDTYNGAGEYKSTSGY